MDRIEATPHTRLVVTGSNDRAPKREQLFKINGNYKWLPERIVTGTPDGNVQDSFDPYTGYLAGHWPEGVV